MQEVVPNVHFARKAGTLDYFHKTVHYHKRWLKNLTHISWLKNINCQIIIDKGTFSVLHPAPSLSLFAHGESMGIRLC